MQRLMCRFLSLPALGAMLIAAALSPILPEASALSLWPDTQKQSLPPQIAGDVLEATPCTAPKSLSRLDSALNQTARRLAANEAVTIVAVGSSSTAGAGASSPAFSYPNRLADELKRRFPQADITVVNRGVNGDEIGNMLARLETTVLSERPTLVLLQMGTNAVLRDDNINEVIEMTREGVARIRAAGADVVLVDSQYAPRVIAKPAARQMLHLTEQLGRQEQVSVFHRFAVMRHWHDQRAIPVESFITQDGLHMTDWGYACFARVFAESISEAVGRGQAVANASMLEPYYYY